MIFATVLAYAKLSDMKGGDFPPFPTSCMKNPDYYVRLQKRPLSSENISDRGSFNSYSSVAITPAAM